MRLPTESRGETGGETGGQGWCGDWDRGEDIVAECSTVTQFHDLCDWK